MPEGAQAVVWFRRKDDAPAREREGEAPDEPQPHRRVIARLRERLSQTRRSLTDGLARVLTGKKIDAGVLDQIEELLITSDIGVQTATALIGRISAAGAATAEELQSVLRQEILAILTRYARPARARGG